MGTKQIASFAVLLCCTTPSLAFDPRAPGPSALFYVEFPLDGVSDKQHRPSFGFSVQGREYRRLEIDTRILNQVEVVGAGIEGKWIAGGAAVLLLLSKSKGGGSSAPQAAAQAPHGGTPAGGGTNPPAGTCGCPTCGC
jgi:hypothetical protein